MSLRDHLAAIKHNWIDRAPFRTRYRSGTWRIRCWDGVTLTFRHNPHLAMIEVHEYLYHGRCPIRPTDVVVDAGAYRGEFAVYVSRVLRPPGRLIVLEPDPDNLHLLHESFEANGGIPDHVTLIPKGLWSESTTLRFASGLGDGSAIVGTGKSGSEKENNCQIEVPVLSLRDVLAEAGAEACDFLKADIEGAEIEVIEASADLLKTSRTLCAIASYHLRDGKPTCETIEPRFKQAGMHAETVIFRKQQLTFAGPDQDSLNR